MRTKFSFLKSHNSTIWILTAVAISLSWSSLDSLFALDIPIRDSNMQPDWGCVHLIVCFCGEEMILIFIKRIQTHKRFHDSQIVGISAECVQLYKYAMLNSMFFRSSFYMELALTMLTH